MLNKLKEKRQQADEGMFCYHFCIDFGWERLQTVRDVANILFENHIGILKFAKVTSFGELEDFLCQFEEAKSLAREHGWDGSFIRGPCVFSLPSGICGSVNDFCYAFVWKQSNNGSTFVISPIELPWLEEHRCDHEN